MCGCGSDNVCWIMCQYDQNNDGKITFNEYKKIEADWFGIPVSDFSNEELEDLGEFFSEWDTNKDGRVTADELYASYEAYEADILAMDLMFEAVAETCGDDYNCWNEAFPAEY